MLGAYTGDENGLVEELIDDETIPLETVVDHDFLVAVEYEEGGGFRLLHLRRHLNDRLHAIVVDADGFPGGGTGNTVGEVEVAQIFLGFRDC